MTCSRAPALPGCRPALGLGAGAAVGGLQRRGEISAALPAGEGKVILIEAQGDSVCSAGGWTPVGFLTWYWQEKREAKMHPKLENSVFKTRCSELSFSEKCMHQQLLSKHEKCCNPASGWVEWFKCCPAVNQACNQLSAPVIHHFTVWTPPPRAINTPRDVNTKRDSSRNNKQRNLKQLELGRCRRGEAHSIKSSKWVSKSDIRKSNMWGALINHSMPSCWVYFCLIHEKWCVRTIIQKVQSVLLCGMTKGNFSLFSSVKNTHLEARFDPTHRNF